jgi:hypothetical protein
MDLLHNWIQASRDDKQQESQGKNISKTDGGL